MLLLTDRADAEAVLEFVEHLMRGFPETPAALRGPPK